MFIEKPIGGSLPFITKGATPRIPSSLPKLPSNKSGVKKFDPNSLTSSDVQELNETILKKFTEAMYLSECHDIIIVSVTLINENLTHSCYQDS